MLIPPKYRQSTSRLNRGLIAFEPAERLVERDDDVGRLVGWQIQRRSSGNLLAEMPASLAGFPAHGVVHEDPSHRLRGDREKMRAVLPGDAVEPDQLDVRFVDDRRCVERVVTPLPTQMPTRNLTQLVVDRSASAGRRTVAAAAQLRQ